MKNNGRSPHRKKAKSVPDEELRNKMIAGLLHDFKNLLSPMLLMPDLVMRLIPEEQNKRVYGLMKQMKKNMQLISGKQEIIYNYAKGENIKLNLAMCNVSAMIEDFLEIIGPRFESSLDFKLEFNYPGDIRTDKSILLYQVLLNIIKNAGDFFHGHGRGELTIRTYSYKGYVSRNGVNPGLTSSNYQDLVIMISDNGPGIPREIEEHFFEAFVTHGKEGGTGLGSWMVKNGIEDLLGGKLFLENRIGEGVTYHILIPSATEENSC